MTRREHSLQIIALYFYRNFPHRYLLHFHGRLQSNRCTPICPPSALAILASYAIYVLLRQRPDTDVIQPLIFKKFFYPSCPARARVDKHHPSDPLS